LAHSRHDERDISGQPVEFGDDYNACAPRTTLRLVEVAFENIGALATFDLDKLR
jgi:hypothetical protein